MEIHCEVESQRKIKSFLIPNTKIRRKENGHFIEHQDLSIKLCIKIVIIVLKRPSGFFFILYNKIVFLSKCTQWLRDRFNLSIHTYCNEHDFTLEWSLKLKSI